MFFAFFVVIPIFIESFFFILRFASFRTSKTEQYVASAYARWMDPIDEYYAYLKENHLITNINNNNNNVGEEQQRNAG